jgi:hypothetical protein
VNQISHVCIIGGHPVRLGILYIAATIEANKTCSMISRLGKLKQVAHARPLL